MARFELKKASVKEVVETVVNPGKWYPVCRYHEASKASAVAVLRTAATRLTEGLLRLRNLAKVIADELGTESDETPNVLQVHADNIEFLCHSLEHLIGARDGTVVGDGESNTIAEVLRVTESSLLDSFWSKIDRICARLYNVIESANTLIEDCECGRVANPVQIQTFLQSDIKRAIQYTERELNQASKIMDSICISTMRMWKSSVRRLGKRKGCDLPLKAGE